MKQSQPLRIESSEFASFGTSRTARSHLWFVNNQTLERRILGFLAKYREKYRIPLYAMVFSGSHYHLLTRFPECNRAMFYRDFNARIAEAVRSLVRSFGGGQVFARRYAEQAVPTNQDILERFFYCALQPVMTGLCRSISDYPGYNSFYDAIYGRVRKIKVIEFSRYQQAKRYRRNARPDEYSVEYELRYERLPGFEHLTQKEYARVMLAEIQKRTAKIVAAWERKGHVYMTKTKLRNVSPSSTAKRPKISTRLTFRPLVLTSSQRARKLFLSWYFDIYKKYKKAVARYTNGDTAVIFPPGTYRPPLYMTPTFS